jgi:hypothetical protein
MNDQMETGESTLANPGSTLGEAIGALIEREVNRLLRAIAEDNGCIYMTAGRPNPRTGRPTKLLLRDNAGNEYNIDSVIANRRVQPLVLVESKYQPDTQHDYDESNRICSAHGNLRRAYPTIRKSAAVIAGSWSASSKDRMRSFGITLFEVGLPEIHAALGRYGVDISWDETERDRAVAAWESWSRLTDENYADIGCELLAVIEPELQQSITSTLHRRSRRRTSGERYTSRTGF